jgi:protoporphyrinogen oxidase
MRTIVLGAGLSGLACATALRLRGADVVLVEREAEVGGLAKSVRIDGYTFDYGPHFLFGRDVLPLLADTLSPGLDLLPMRRANEKMYFRDRYFTFPFDPKDLLRQMEPRLMPGILWELLRRNVFLQFSDESERGNVEDWVIRGVGKRVYDYISLGGYINKLYGLPATRISQDWGIQKLKFLSRWRESNILRLATNALREERRVKQNVIHYPPGGIDAIARGIAATYASLRGELLCGAEISGVERHGERVQVRYRSAAGDGTVEGDFVVSTLPVGKFVAMLSPEPPKPVLEAARFLRHRTLLLVLLCLGKERALDYTSIYFTEPQFPFRRITEFKHLSASMAPKEKTSLCVEITCFDDDPVAQEDRSKLLASVIEPLERGRFIRTSDIDTCHVLRVANTYPVYEVGYEGALGTLLEHLAALDNVVSIGRQGLFFYNLMHNCMLGGYGLAEGIHGRDAVGRHQVIQRLYAERREKYTSARSSGPSENYAN